MFEVNVKIISELKAFLGLCISPNHPHLLDAFRYGPKDFIRQRKLSFSRLILFITRLSKKTLSIELDHFFAHELGTPLSCSVSAFCQQRKKLHHCFFFFWNKVLTDSFYHYGKKLVRTWRGHRLIAADGSGVSLINTKELSEHFGGQCNQTCHFTAAKAFFHYDVLNDLFTHSLLAPYRTSEHRLAHASIDQLPSDAIAIYDRNFCYYKTIARHQFEETPAHFVIRASMSPRYVRDFVASQQESAVIVIYPSAAAIESLAEEKIRVNKDTGIAVRLVRVELLGKEEKETTVEVLLTNLMEEDGYEASCFSGLYFKRWGVETAIDIIKNKLNLEAFSSLSVESVYQDFYATVVVANLASLIARQAQGMHRAEERKRTQTQIGLSPGRKWVRKVNMNKGCGGLRNNLTALLSSGTPRQILAELGAYFGRHLLPVRPGRTFERVVKNRRSRSKHRTYSNFKPAF